MKILLVQPKMNKRPMDTNLKMRMSPSLALLTLIALTPKEHEIKVINENIEKIDFAWNIDLVAITVTLDVMPRACQIATKFKERNIPVVAGGIHVTCCPEDCVNHFDSICIGPAERVWTKILNDAKQHNLQKTYSDFKDFKGSEIVSPAYESVDKKKYLYSNVVSTSRGCPNRCSFCYNSCKNRIYIRRPIADVIKDIQSLGTRHIFFIDDNFIGEPDYTFDLLNHIRSMNLTWSAAVTTNIIKIPGLLKLMASTGCQSLFIGFESINPSSLKSVNKSNIVSHYENIIATIHSHGIMVNASMVFGLDGDSAETFKKTLDWLVKMKVETLTSHILTPYPGTELYQKMDDAGRIFNYDLSKYNTASVVFKPSGMPPEVLYQEYRNIYKKFYSFKNIIKRYPNHKAQRKSYLLFNLFYRKFGGFTSLLAHLIPMSVIGLLASKLSFNDR